MAAAQVRLVVPVCLFIAFVFWGTGSTASENFKRSGINPGLFLPNLNDACFACLCHVATTCDLTHRCTGGYCGPFNISRVYWTEAGKVTLPNDDPNRNLAWQSCARDFHCSTNIILGYLEHYGKDCNDDGVTNCYDYMMVNENGGNDCHAPLNRTENGRKWLARFEECRF